MENESWLTLERYNRLMAFQLIGFFAIAEVLGFNGLQGILYIVIVGGLIAWSLRLMGLSNHDWLFLTPVIGQVLFMLVEDDELKKKSVTLAKEENKPESVRNLLKEIQTVKVESQPETLETREVQKVESLPETTEEIIETVLKMHGVSCQVVDKLRGPMVTEYRVLPSLKVKVDQITARHKELGRVLGGVSITFREKIPGTRFVGIQVPNQKREFVDFVKAMEETKTTGLDVVIGKNIAGEYVTFNLTEMPHLIIAGATNSGKSTFTHSKLLNLLYNNSPDDLELVLIDLKKVELSLYEGVPHLKRKIITDTDTILFTMERLILEMTNRNDTFAKYAVQNIKQYNRDHPESKMPYIFVFIEELAQVMESMSKKKVKDSDGSTALSDFERFDSYLQQLAQMARSAGIHVAIATQRPSVDVITGTTKSNFPCRLVFKMSSKVDSRTVIDHGGCEKLLESGDCYLFTGNIDTMERIQACYPGDDLEIKQHIENIKQRWL